jgi:hypothetical protein
MRKTRLNQHTRSVLMSFMKQVVSCPEWDSKVHKAYEKAEALVRALVVAEYPPDDMEICKKYDVAKQDDCIKIRVLDDKKPDIVFSFKSGTGPLVAKMTYQGKFFLADGRTAAAVQNWDALVGAQKKQLEAKQDDYRSLIRNAITFEEVAEIWPEVETLRSQVVKPPIMALMTLSADVVQRIQQDVKARMKRKNIVVNN